MNASLRVNVMRMQTVWTHQVAMSVPVSLATLVMGIHVWTLMSVLLTLVMIMQLVPTIMGASPVNVTQIMWEMGHCVHVSILYRVTMYTFHMLVLKDKTCFVPDDHIHECGSNIFSEKTCEDMGCCYNSSANINCYYPSGELSAHFYVNLACHKK